jgi:hypothetical protein
VLRFAVSGCTPPFSVRESSTRSKHPPLFAPSLPLSHFHLSRTSKPSHGVQDRTRPDNTRPKPKDFSNSKRNAHPFLNNFALPPACLPAYPALPPRAPRRDCTTATGTPTRPRRSVGRSISQSRSAVAVAVAVPHLIFLRLSLSNLLPLMLLLCFPARLASPTQPASLPALPCPCHAHC